mmetsp:Transcript_8167/g.15521  ORF Transcript_8167/g.15521 Transcript_8167/m.15521 type:complete len:226 (+) Transcript_8167:663-1340(+)
MASCQRMSAREMMPTSFLSASTTGKPDLLVCKKASTASRMGVVVCSVTTSRVITCSTRNTGATRRMPWRSGRLSKPSSSSSCVASSDADDARIIDPRQSRDETKFRVLFLVYGRVFAFEHFSSRRLEVNTGSRKLLRFRRGRVVKRFDVRLEPETIICVHMFMLRKGKAGSRTQAIASQRAKGCTVERDVQEPRTVGLLNTAVALTACASLRLMLSDIQAATIYR